jgi:hypothetical protein
MLIELNNYLSSTKMPDKTEAVADPLGYLSTSYEWPLIKTSKELHPTL